MSNLLHSICYQLADLLITRGNSCYSGDLLFAVDLLAHLTDDLDSLLGSLLHALSQDDRVSTCSEVSHALVDHCLCKNGSCGGTITGNIVGLRSDLTDELSAHVFKSVLKLDLFCDRNAVVCDRRSAIGLLKYDIAALRSKGHTYGICQFVNASLQGSSGLFSIFDLFCHD